MSQAGVPLAPEPIDYPESDGQPMSDNTRQFRWITVLAGNIAALFRDRQDVFVCGNQNWYPVQGEPEICAAPDAYAVFGRPKGDRPSYKQWEEGNVPMTVVFEVRSPKNSDAEMAAKFDFYDEHGVEEYYMYDPDTNRLQAYRRGAATLVGVAAVNGYTSPRLGIQFDLSGPELVVRFPDGSPFLTFEELKAERDQEKQRADQEKRRADQEKRRADQERQHAEQEQLRADHAARLAEEETRRANQAEHAAEQARLRTEQEKQVAEQERQRAEQERQRAEQERQRAELERQRAEQERQRADLAERQLARQSELTRKALQQQATPEELQELQRLMGNAERL
jgi:Uma2 family endonuclease